MFNARLTIPEKGNKFYNTVSNGGYSRAIVGKPCIDGLNVLSNCVGYAFGRFHEICNNIKMDLFDPVNAENIFENAQKHGLKTGKNPELGAIAVWRNGTLSGNDGAGHVAIVECINSDGSIITSESGYGAKKPFWTQKRSGANWGQSISYTFIGFVYQPEGTQVNIVKLPIKKGDTGSNVEWLQNKLYQKGYLRHCEIDGYFGKITLGALLAYQFENKLQVDGVCGKMTYNKIK